MAVKSKVLPTARELEIAQRFVDYKKTSPNVAVRIENGARIELALLN